MAGHTGTMTGSHRPQRRINPGRRRLSHPNPADHLRQLARGDPVGVDCGGSPPVLLQPVNVSINQHRQLGVERDLAPGGRSAPRPQRLDERILSQLAVLVADRAAPLDDPCHPVAVAITAAGQPNPVTEVLAADLAVRADPQRRPTCH